MAASVTEGLVEWLREKIGDNPIDTDGNPDESLQIWSDPELEDSLKDARLSLFKGQKTTYDELSSLEKSWIVKKARADLMLVLGINSARYAKYTVRDVEAERLSPAAFLDIFAALNTDLKEEMMQADEGIDLGPTVKEGILKKYDYDKDIERPTRYLKPGVVPEPQFASVATGVEITIPYVFIADYRTHLIKRMLPLPETIIVTYDVLTQTKYIDTDATSGGTEYTYRIMIEKSTGDYIFKDYTFTYETP